MQKETLDPTRTYYIIAAVGDTYHAVLWVEGDGITVCEDEAGAEEFAVEGRLRTGIPFEVFPFTGSDLVQFVANEEAPFVIVFPGGRLIPMVQQVTGGKAAPGRTRIDPNFFENR